MSLKSEVAETQNVQHSQFLLNANNLQIVIIMSKITWQNKIISRNTGSIEMMIPFQLHFVLTRFFTHFFSMNTCLDRNDRKDMHKIWTCIADTNYTRRSKKLKISRD